MEARCWRGNGRCDDRFRREAARSRGSRASPATVGMARPPVVCGSQGPAQTPSSQAGGSRRIRTRRARYRQGFEPASRWIGGAKLSPVAHAAPGSSAVPRRLPPTPQHDPSSSSPHGSPRLPELFRAARPGAAPSTAVLPPGEAPTPLSPRPAAPEPRFGIAGSNRTPGGWNHSQVGLRTHGRRPADAGVRAGLRRTPAGAGRRGFLTSHPLSHGVPPTASTHLDHKDLTCENASAFPPGCHQSAATARARARASFSVLTPRNALPARTSCTASAGPAPPSPSVTSVAASPPPLTGAAAPTRGRIT